jgi:Flp pilus assembly protein TadG
VDAQHLLAKFTKLARRFGSAQRGGVAVIFALSIIPVFGMVGAAVDYSRANLVKVALQAAADSTALIVSKTAATATSSNLQSQAVSYFNALFIRPEATGLQITAKYDNTNGSRVQVTATANVAASFMRLMGISTMQVGATSQVKWGNSRVRVALVLDNTGSMLDDGKMPALITATKNLLDQLKAAAVNNGDVYVSIIPFVKDVNAGKSNYAATWIDWTDWDSQNGSCSKGNAQMKYDCLNQNGNPKWTADAHNTWNGCVTDRGIPGDTATGRLSTGPSSGNYDTNVTVPTTTITATLFAAEQYGACPKAAMPLNYDWATMTNLVNGMTPNGNTNQAVGLQLGWQSLVGGGSFPVPPVMDPNYKYMQVIILLTDGLNTQDRWYTSQASIDTRQAMTCVNVKAAGFVLYTVQVNTGGDPTSSLLKTCASDLTKFFLLTKANQMVATFQQIGTALSNLRIAQ